MRNLEIRPEDVLIISEFRLSELKKLQHIMDKVTVSVNLQDRVDKEAHDFFVGNFQDWLNTTIGTIEDA